MFFQGALIRSQILRTLKFLFKVRNFFKVRCRSATYRRTDVVRVFPCLQKSPHPFDVTNCGRQTKGIHPHLKLEVTMGLNVIVLIFSLINIIVIYFYL